MKFDYRHFLLLLGDFTFYLLIIFLLWGIDFYIRQIDTVIFSNYLFGLLSFFPFFVLLFYIFDLYNDDTTMNGIALLKASFNASLINALLAFFWLHKLRPFFYVRSILTFVLFALISFILFSLTRRIYALFFSSKRSLRPALILTTGESVEHLISEIDLRPYCGLKIVGTFNPLKENLDLLEEKISADKKLSLIVEDGLLSDKKMIHFLFRLLPRKVQVLRQSNFFENLCHYVFMTEVGEHWFVDHLTLKKRNLYEIFKGLSEKVLSIFLLLTLFPVFILLSLFIIITSGFPLFYTQKRVGFEGKIFTLYKFRTMKKDSEKEGATWAKKNDPRITFIGKFLRQTRLDELPQLFNILKGEMSFIGPRPERPEFTEKLSQIIPYYNERHLVRPGLTGWAQVSYPYGMNEMDALKKLQYDLYYIKNRSLILDIAIILKTIRVVIYKNGT